MSKQERINRIVERCILVGWERLADYLRVQLGAGMLLGEALATFEYQSNGRRIGVRLSELAL